jgi:hypothetical protein
LLATSVDADSPRLLVDVICRVAALLGLDVSIGLYPSGSPVRDAAHLALLERLRIRLGPSRRLSLEVPMPIAGDMRSVAAGVDPGGDVLILL